MALIDLDPRPPQVRQFARLWLPLFGVVAAAWLLRRGYSPAAAGTAAAVVAGLTIAAVARETFARRLFITLLTLTAPIGWAVSLVLLAAIYFLLLTPLAMVRRRSGDLLRLRRVATASYWEPRATDLRPDQHFRQF